MPHVATNRVYARLGAPVQPIRRAARIRVQLGHIADAMRQYAMGMEMGEPNADQLAVMRRTMAAASTPRGSVP